MTMLAEVAGVAQRRLLHFKKARELHHIAIKGVLSSLGKGGMIDRDAPREREREK